MDFATSHIKCHCQRVVCNRLVLKASNVHDSLVVVQLKTYSIEVHIVNIGINTNRVFDEGSMDLRIPDTILSVEGGANF